MRFGFFENGNSFQSFVQRLFDLESQKQESELHGFQVLSSDLKGDLGIDGFLPDGTVFQIYYPLPHADTPVSKRLLTKANSTLRRITKRKTDIEAIIGHHIRKVIFVFPLDPDISLYGLLHKNFQKLQPTIKPRVWGETRLNNLLAEHRNKLSDITALVEQHAKVTTNEIYPHEEMVRINDIFVPPGNYEDAKKQLNDKRLLIITGPSGIGKTTMGLKLLIEIKEAKSHVKEDILKPDPTTASLGCIKGSEGFVIIFDAPFGEHDDYEPKDGSFVAGFDEVFDLRRKNWVVITSRRQAFETAAQVIERRNLDNYRIDIDEIHYGEDRLQQILLKHLNYYVKKKEITPETHDIARRNAEWIALALSFPHNIYRFVKDNLSGVSDRESLVNAVNNSKDTKEASKQYFLKLRGEARYFFLFVTLFPDVFDAETSKHYLEKFLSVYSFPAYSNVALLRKDIRYVREWGKITFEHQDYLDGATEAINDKTFIEDIARLREFLEELTKDDIIIRQAICFALTKLTRVNPEEAIPLVISLLRDNNRQVIESAFLPLKYIVKDHFSEVRTYLENIVDVDDVRKSDPNYRYIVYHKAVRDYLIGYYIDSDDINGFIDFLAKYRISLSLRGEVIMKLKDTWVISPNKAQHFFAKWYKEKPGDALRGIEETISTKWVGSTGKVPSTFPKFVADILDSIPPKDAVKAIAKWSSTESKNDKLRRNYAKILLPCLARIIDRNLGMALDVVGKWEKDGNDIQRNIVESLNILKGYQ